MEFFHHHEAKIAQLEFDINILRVELKLAHLENRRLLEIIDRLVRKLSYIKIAIGGRMPVGPATLTVGDKKTATVLGFDQFGAPFAIDFTANPVTWVDDNEAIVQDAPAADGSDALTAVAPGVVNLTATCAGLSDTETVTSVAAVPVPVLSSVKISID